MFSARSIDLQLKLHRTTENAEHENKHNVVINAVVDSKPPCLNMSMLKMSEGFLLDGAARFTQ